MSSLRLEGRWDLQPSAPAPKSGLRRPREGFSYGFKQQHCEEIEDFKPTTAKVLKRRVDLPGEGAWPQQAGSASCSLAVHEGRLTKLTTSSKLRH